MSKNSQWEDAVSREFVDRVGVILARHSAAYIDAFEALEDLKDDYETTIGDLPNIPDENEEESI